MQLALTGKIIDCRFLYVTAFMTWNFYLIKKPVESSRYSGTFSHVKQSKTLEKNIFPKDILFLKEFGRKRG